METKTEKCTVCGDMFTKKGLSGHMAFKHKGGAGGVTSEGKKAPSSSSSPSNSERKPAAGGSDYDSLLFD
jgi:hypothetical protein